MKKYAFLACLVLLTVVWACDDDSANPDDGVLTNEELIAGVGENSSKTWRITAMEGRLSLGLLSFDVHLQLLKAQFPVPIRSMQLLQEHGVI